MTHPRTLDRAGQFALRRGEFDREGSDLVIQQRKAFLERQARAAAGDDEQVDDTLDEGDGGSTRVLTFAATRAGAEEAAGQARETETFRGTERLKLEATLNALAVDLLPPGEGEVAMKAVRRGEWMNSKLMFQAVMQNLADAAAVSERSLDLELREKNEAETLRDARARITIDMMGRDVGRAILFALGAA